jgi:serine/threonine protein kinase
LLVELICVDLEFRWRSAGTVAPIALAGYVERFPELGALDRLPIELIGEEYRVRCLWGDRPSHEAFLAPFRARHEPIGRELVRVDAELAAEASEPSGTRFPATLDSRDLPDLAALGPLRSHHDFLLRRLIGAGRMGKVYEAREHGTGRAVAVKFLRKTLLHHPEVVRRFIGEARTVARLRHPNIVGTEGLGRTPAGAYFLVMDLVRGVNLAQLGRQRTIAVEEVVGWTIAVCDALEHAHERGVVHCDLKPANLLLDERGTIRVTDFGLARSLAGDTPWAAEVEGTAPFMAPEQASRAWGPIDGRTDVYGVGAVIFTLLTGRAPFLGRRLPDLLAQVISATPVVPPARLRPGLAEPLSELCRKCLSKAPGGRFPSIAEVRRALVEVRADGP